jgi:hypothetical protein
LVKTPDFPEHPAEHGIHLDVVMAAAPTRIRIFEAVFPLPSGTIPAAKGRKDYHRNTY